MFSSTTLGLARLDWFEALDPVKDIQGQITVDLLGVIWTARAVLPQMYAQRSGHIINMCSIGGWAAPPLYTVYSAAKFGVRGFTEALRRETTPFGVNVSAVYPGGAATEFQKHIGENKAKKRFVTPEWLRVTPEDVAAGVVRLAKRLAAQSVFTKDHGTFRLLQFAFPGDFGQCPGKDVCVLSRGRHERKVILSGLNNRHGKRKTKSVLRFYHKLFFRRSSWQIHFKEK